MAETKSSISQSVSDVEAAAQSEKGKGLKRDPRLVDTGGECPYIDTIIRLGVTNPRYICYEAVGVSETD